MEERSAGNMFPEIPVSEVPLISLLRKRFRRMGEKSAIRFMRGGVEETCISYERLDRESDLVAQYLAERGVKAGDRVLIFLPKCLEWVIAHLAVQKAGAITVPLNPAYKIEELEYFVNETEPALAVAGPEQAEKLGRINPGIPLWMVDSEKPGVELPGPERGAAALESSVAPGTSEAAMLMYTSGTTGKPKGAILTHSSLCHDAQNVAAIWEISSKDVFCHALPLFHAHGLCFGLHASLLAGATIIMLDSFKPETTLEVLRRKETTLFMAVPTMYRKLLEAGIGSPDDYSHLRLITSGSAPLLVKDFERITRAFGMEPVEREGMTETLMNFSNPVRGKRKPGSVGLPLPGLQVRIVDPQTLTDVNEGQTGEIWLKGPSITPGYYKKPAETREAFVQGWFRTGDLGSCDSRGYYYIKDRIKNIIITGGENVSPSEIEVVINSSDGVAESCVVGLPDSTWGEAVAAAVVKSAGSKTTENDVKEICKARLMDWKCPKKIIFVETLPKNRMGKVIRTEVKKLFQDINKPD